MSKSKNTTTTTTNNKEIAMSKKTFNEDAIKAALIQAQSNKSQAIRDLDAAGFTRSQIKNILGIRYQFVKNVLDRGAPKRAAADKRVSELQALVRKLQAELSHREAGEVASKLQAQHVQEASTVNATTKKARKSKDNKS